MIRLASALGVIVALLLIVVAVVPAGLPFGGAPAAQAQAAAVFSPEPQVAAPAPSGPPPVKVPPPVADVLQSGVLIVISKASQRMYVFKDGVPWASSPVSTGKRGHGTPAGVFPILQKRVHHRSNLYSNAPMPYMQRLTWRGIAIHAGRLPGYPASHGCIRLPYSFARALFSLTRADSTTVVVTNEAIGSDDTAVTLALNTQHPQSISPVPLPLQKPEAALAAVTLPVTLTGAGQTIQLAAATSADEAEARWTALVARYPALAGFRKSVVPAVVQSRQYYRLRASAPGAHAYCASLKRSGQDCFKVS